MRDRLRKGQKCPLHDSYFCCGRKPLSEHGRHQYKKPQSSIAVQVVVDNFHPRGFREICNRQERLRRKMRLLAKGIRDCFYCHDPLESFGDTELAHIEPKGMGGARRDDHMDNLTLAHRRCNHANGSKRPIAA